MAHSPISEKVKIFFSLAFASEDEGLFERLRTHLSPMRRQGLIEVWNDSTIIAGGNVRQIIESYISSADIIVLLISASFFDSDRCTEIEMKYALEESKKRQKPVIPVILRPTDLRGSSLEKYKPLPPDGKPVTVWDNLDTALLVVATGIRKVVEEIAGRVARRITGSSSQPKQPQFPLYMVPDKQNLFFTDREDILASLHDFFQSYQGTQTRMRAISGLGGMGKTLLAMEYARLHQDEYQAVLWLNTASREILNSDLSSLLDQLGIFVEDGENEKQRFDALKLWLQQHDRWLIILDDLDDFTLINQLLPQNSRGHALLITHSRAIGSFASAIPITQMSTEEAALLLLRRAKVIPERASHDAAPEAKYQQALALAREVGGYPLALDQAGAYIEETQRSLASYLDLYQQRRGTLLGMRGQIVNDHPDPVTATLALTFEKVAQVDPAALQLLHLFAFLHADAIPDEMLMHNAFSLDEPLRSLVADSITLDGALATIQKFSLIHRLADTTTVNIHRIVQTALIESLTKDQQRQLATQVVRLVASSFPEASFANWASCERYLPHAQRCDKLILDYQLAFNEAALLLQRLGSYCYKRALYPQAETYLQHALSLCEQLLGSEHPD
ncbi:MAG: TIR domain-containing protein, partial [Ktedonobacteraceae bacterium]|nr:TIR domain-containing protein [Ktedonobacteraceae bacterium]